MDYGNVTRYDVIRLSGLFHILLRDKNGKIKEERIVTNLLTTTGLATVACLIAADVTKTGFDYIAVGTSTAALAASNSSLTGEVVRVGTTGTVTTTTGTNDTAQLVATTSFGASWALTEAAVFNAASAGDMLCRQTFAAVNVISGDSIQITYKIKAA